MVQPLCKLLQLLKLLVEHAVRKSLVLNCRRLCLTPGHTTAEGTPFILVTVTFNTSKKQLGNKLPLPNPQILSKVPHLTL